MNIYLIRHTEPRIAKGVCYGQADLDVTESFFSEAAIIRQHLPANITAVYSSPLQRCKMLAEHLFTDQPILLEDDLKEIDCGNWEMKAWSDISKAETDPWMQDLANVRIPGGESYTDMLNRVSNCFDKITDSHPDHTPDIAIVTHGGVIRSLLSYITGTPLLDSFKTFSFHYGCVIRLLRRRDRLDHEVLSNIVREKETHKPSA